MQPLPAANTVDSPMTSVAGSRLDARLAVPPDIVAGGSRGLAMGRRPGPRAAAGMTRLSRACGNSAALGRVRPQPGNTA